MYLKLENNKNYKKNVEKLEDNRFETVTSTMLSSKAAPESNIDPQKAGK